MAEQVDISVYIKEALPATLRTYFPTIKSLKPQQEEAISNVMQRRASCLISNYPYSLLLNNNIYHIIIVILNYL